LPRCCGKSLLPEAIPQRRELLAAGIMLDLD